MKTRGVSQVDSIVIDQNGPAGAIILHDEHLITFSCRAAHLELLGVSFVNLIPNRFLKARIVQFVELALSVSLRRAGLVSL